MKKVTGLGGIFFKCKDPHMMKEWYQKHLGITYDQYGSIFEWGGPDSAHGTTVFSMMPASTDYYDPSTSLFMINFRVADLEGLLKELKAAGVELAGEMQSYEYGKFGSIMDPEGNKIELWEPVDSGLEEPGDHWIKMS